MTREIRNFAVAAAAAALLSGSAAATTREIADFRPTRLAFGQSVLNQLSYETYRDPYDELQTRPYNLLFANIGRHATLSPWAGQEGVYTRYFNALIGNNGAANVDNDADAIQGSLVRRETARLAWGASAAFLSGSDTGNAASGTATFSDTDEIEGYELRGAAAFQLSERQVLGAGVRVTLAASEVASGSFEAGVGGFRGSDEFEQAGVLLDVGLRHFRTAGSSWEVGLSGGVGTVERDEFSENLDDTGAVTDRFVIADHDISEVRMGLHAGYNRLRRERIGETQYRLSVEREQRELDNSDLAYSQSGGVVTPDVTLLDQDAVSVTGVRLSAETVFPAGETEMFGGASVAFHAVDGSTQVDAGGVLVREGVDDSQVRLGLTVGLRQPLVGDKLRFVVSGHADVLDRETGTIFDTSSNVGETSISTAQYAIGLEGVLANVTFDVAWLGGEEAPVVPVDLGLPAGSRRSVELDRLVFSAAVSW